MSEEASAIAVLVCTFATPVALIAIAATILVIRDVGETAWKWMSR